MMNRNASLRLAYGLFALCLICTAALADDAPRNIVLIGWDGCQRNHLKGMIASNEAPNLMALAKDGKFVDIDITTGATDTKAGDSRRSSRQSSSSVRPTGWILR